MSPDPMGLFVRLAAFAYAAFVTAIELPVRVLGLAAVIVYCVTEGAFVGYLVYVAVFMATGKGFTAVLVGSLWAAAVAARALLARLAAGRREE